MKILVYTIIALTFSWSMSVSAQVPSFLAPDTVCANTPVTITNTSTGGSTYYWSFCDADLKQTPQAANIGDIGNTFAQPVWMDIVSQNGNYYGFLTNHYPGGLVRLDFGNSLLNTPTATALGNFGGAINAGYGTEGIQVVQNNGNWYALIVGGDPISGGTPRMTQINFGPNLNNPAPVATNWGNLGNMDQPIGFYVFQDNGSWYGFSANATNNTFTRFAFGTNLDVPPVATNLGNPGGYFDYPTSINPLKDPNTGNWYAFVTNGHAYSPDALERLDFGNSLLNAPTAVLLGNPGNVIAYARDIKIIQQCDQIIGFIPDATNNDIIQLNFSNNLLSVPTAVSLGNLGDLDFAHSLSKLFRVGPDLYSFVCNVSNNTITRLRFTGCTSSNIPNSTLQNPPVISYSQPGLYHINLIMDDGLSTQSSFCKTIFVKTFPALSLGDDTTLCQGDSLVLGFPQDPALRFKWQDGSGTNTFTARNTGQYTVVVNDQYGCSASDSVNIAFTTLPMVSTRPDTAICRGASVVLASAVQNSDSVKWMPATGLSDPSLTSPVASPVNATSYILTAFHQDCPVRDTVSINVLADPIVSVTPDTLVCMDSTLQLQASGAAGYRWYPSRGLSDTTVADPVVTPDTTGYFYVKGIGGNGCITLDSVLVTAKVPASWKITPAVSAICVGDTVQFDLQETNGSPGDPVEWLSAIGSQDPSGHTVLVSPGLSSSFQVVGIDNICKRRDTLTATVNVNALPTVTAAKSNDIGCVYGDATLTATGGVRYNWTPAGSLSDPFSPNPVARTDTTTLYYVKATDQNGCTGTDSIQVTVTKSGGNIGFPVANAFTPNGDGVNDRFGVKYWGYISEFEMSVFSRWGLRVFYTRNPEEGWDGTYGGKMQPAGTYVYAIKAFTLCGETVRNGTVELIR